MNICVSQSRSGWAEEATSILGDVSGPGDIPTTEVTLVGTDTGTHIEGDIPKMSFDTAYVQSLEISGFITRTYTDATPDEVEYFDIGGAYNGTVTNHSVEYAGDDTELEFSTNGGQFRFKYLKKANTDKVTIKYSAKTKIDESFFE